jgi:hypothetical protein
MPRPFLLAAAALLAFAPSLAPGAGAAPGAPAWLAPARRLSGEGDKVRTAALRELRQIPAVESELRRALEGPHLYLALDAAVALRLTSLYDDILRTSARDRAGFSYLALASLVDPERQAALALVFRERVTQAETPAPSKVVILDTLLRMRERLTPSSLAVLLLEDPSPEVKSAALYYLRGFLLRTPRDPGADPEYLALLRKTLQGQLSLQRRAQICSLIQELGDPSLQPGPCQPPESAAQ